MARLLVVDDESSICWAWSRLATTRGHQVATAASAEEAFETLATGGGFDAVVLDVRLPGMDGLSAMPVLREKLGDAPIIIMTAYGDLNTAVEAVRRGAFDYLVKPFDLATAERVLDRALRRGPAPTSPTPRMVVAAGTLVGASPPMQQVFKQIALASGADACVHVTGESGTGKDLIARAIHRYSRRSAQPFVAVHVAGLSQSLAESELFGHVRGAFTGAVETRRGLLEQADGGTVFLDEIAEIPLTLQVKLLRALEFGEIIPVGASQPRHVDFRIISATHADLRERVVDGSFREDLYYRLHTFEIHMPPLRDRLSDLPLLVEHFLDVTCQSNQLSRPTVTAETFAELHRRPWHGNVRELRNTIEYATIQARGGALLPDHLPPPVMAVPRKTSDPASNIAAALRDWTECQWQTGDAPREVYQRLLELVEPPVFSAALENSGGQFAVAARALGLHRVTLRRKMAAQTSGERSAAPDHAR